MNFLRCVPPPATCPCRRSTEPPNLKGIRGGHAARRGGGLSFSICIGSKLGVVVTSPALARRCSATRTCSSPAATSPTPRAPSPTAAATTSSGTPSAPPGASSAGSASGIWSAPQGSTPCACSRTVISGFALFWFEEDAWPSWLSLPSRLLTC